VLCCYCYFITGKILKLFDKVSKKFNLVRNCRRDGDEDTTFEAKTKDSEGVQGQGPSCRGQVASRPKTKRLEAKAKDLRTLLNIRENINVNIVIMISQTFKRKIVKK